MSKSDCDMDGLLEEAVTLLHRVMSRHSFWTEVAALSGVNIDKSSAIILFVLADDSRPWRIQDLAQKLGVEAPSVTRKVQQLERSGLVLRHDDASDRRASLLSLTALGKKANRRIRSAKRALLTDVLKQWPESDREQFIVLFNRFARDTSLSLAQKDKSVESTVIIK